LLNKNQSDAYNFSLLEFVRRLYRHMNNLRRIMAFCKKAGGCLPHKALYT